MNAKSGMSKGAGCPEVTWNMAMVKNVQTYEWYQCVTYFGVMTGYEHPLPQYLG
jgi:hypothetical protein